VSQRSRKRGSIPEEKKKEDNSLSEAKAVRGEIGHVPQGKKKLSLSILQESRGLLLFRLQEESSFSRKSQIYARLLKRHHLRGLSTKRDPDGTSGRKEGKGSSIGFSIASEEKEGNKGGRFRAYSRRVMDVH